MLLFYALLCFPVASALFFLCILWFVFMNERFQFGLKKKKKKFSNLSGHALRLDKLQLNLVTIQFGVQVKLFLFKRLPNKSKV